MFEMTVYLLTYLLFRCDHNHKLTFSTNLFHHSLLAPTWTAFLDYTGLLCLLVSHF